VRISLATAAVVGFVLTSISRRTASIGPIIMIPTWFLLAVWWRRPDLQCRLDHQRPRVSGARRRPGAHRDAGGFTVTVTRLRGGLSLWRHQRRRARPALHWRE
jgi:hypothetical protein